MSFGISLLNIYNEYAISKAYSKGFLEIVAMHLTIQSLDEEIPDDLAIISLISLKIEGC